MDNLPKQGDTVVYNDNGTPVEATVVKVLTKNKVSTLVLSIQREKGKAIVTAPYSPNQSGGWAWPAEQLPVISASEIEVNPYIPSDYIARLNAQSENQLTNTTPVVLDYTHSLPAQQPGKPE